MHLRLLTWSLRHRRWRHVLNIITMMVTASVVMLFVSVMSQLLAFVDQSTGKELTRILAMPKMLGGGTPMSLAPTLQAIDGVKVVQRYQHMTGRHESGATYLVIGEEASGVELNTDFFPVEPAVIEAWKNEYPLGAIVTEQTANDLRLKVGQVAEVPTSQGPLKIKVVGLSYGGVIGQRIAVHFNYLQEFSGKPGKASFRVFCKPDDFEKVARGVEEATKNSGTPLQAFDSSQFAASWARKASTVPIILGFLGFFLIFTTALTLANNSAIAIRERRTETATMRVLGYHRRTIAILLIEEAILIGLIGGLLAIGLTMILFRGGVQLTPGSTQFLRPVSLGVVGIAAGLMTAVVVPLAGVLPSALASLRLPLVDALRDA